jgi:ribosomal subunit interface protein
MKLEIRGRRVEITDTIRAYIERRVNFALDRFAERIRRVRITVRDVNSSRGGIDKHCQLSLSFTHSSPITLESRDVSIQGAIDRLSSKVRCLIGRHFGRDRRSRRLKRIVRQLFESPSYSGVIFLRGISS